MKEKRELETELFHIGLMFMVAGIVVWAIYDFLFHRLLPEVPCIFLAAFGIYCPGCGGTRAFRAFLEGRFLLSLWYHPLILYAAVIGGGFMLTQGLHRFGLKCVKGWRFHNWYLYGAVLLVICNFFLKNVLRLICGITM